MVPLGGRATIVTGLPHATTTARKASIARPRRAGKFAGANLARYVP